MGFNAAGRYALSFDAQGRHFFAGSPQKYRRQKAVKWRESAAKGGEIPEQFSEAAPLLASQNGPAAAKIAIIFPIAAVIFYAEC